MLEGLGFGVWGLGPRLPLWAAVGKEGVASTSGASTDPSIPSAENCRMRENILLAPRPTRFAAIQRTGDGRQQEQSGRATGAMHSKRSRESRQTLPGVGPDRAARLPLPCGRTAHRPHNGGCAHRDAAKWEAGTSKQIGSPPRSPAPRRRDRAGMLASAMQMQAHACNFGLRLAPSGQAPTFFAVAGFRNSS
jgi:hypothetical protein